MPPGPRVVRRAGRGTLAGPSCLLELHLDAAVADRIHQRGMVALIQRLARLEVGIGQRGRRMRTLQWQSRVGWVTGPAHANRPRLGSPPPSVVEARS